MKLFFCKNCKRLITQDHCYRCGEVLQEARTVEYNPENKSVAVNGDSFEIFKNHNKRDTGR